MFLDFDEGYCYDYLSILQVKKDKIGGALDLENYNKSFLLIQYQVGSDLHSLISQSKEYYNLYVCNLKIFEIIDIMRQKKVDKGFIVDSFNLERWQYKRELQRKYFGGDIKETKLIYDK